MGQALKVFTRDGESDAMHSKYIVHVKTGDRKGAGTDANVFIQLVDETGNKSQEIKLDAYLRNDFERGASNKFSLSKLRGSSSSATALGSRCPGNPSQSKIRMPTTGQQDIRGDIVKIEVWRDDSGVYDDWYVEHIEVERVGNKQRLAACHFPVHRWIHANVHYTFQQYDAMLPQHDENQKQRQWELQLKRSEYQYQTRMEGFPTQIKTMPNDEVFSNDYKWDILKKKTILLAESKLINLVTTDNWKSLEDIKQLYRFQFPVPKCVTDDWRSDVNFGRQRICGPNNVLIRTCHELPKNLAVSEEILSGFLEGNELSDLLKARRIFYTDHKILDTLPKTKDKIHLCAPLALFYLNNSKQLVPVAIQLYQQPSPANPVYYPSDPQYAWLLAKMWYNNADAQFHQAVVHLGFTHILMEGVCICTHRNLSPSHPIFKLLAPHFLFLIAINTRAIALLVNEGGWVDQCMTQGRIGMFELMKRGVSEWRLDQHGTLIHDLASRGFFDPDLLPPDYWTKILTTEEISAISEQCNPIPGYHWRHDALVIFESIKAYVVRIVTHYYSKDGEIVEDRELQAWAGELVASKEIRNSTGEIVGCGIQGVPGNGKFTKREEVIQVLVSIIFTSSVTHATSFVQYNEYGFPPNYPALMNGHPIADKEAIREEDVIKAVPNKEVTIDTMVITKIISEPPTNPLGHFEVQYLYEAECVKAADEFRTTLRDISARIKQRSKTDKYPYNYLDPETIPNSISI